MDNTGECLVCMENHELDQENFSCYPPHDSDDNQEDDYGNDYNEDDYDNDGTDHDDETGSDQDYDNNDDEGSDYHDDYHGDEDEQDQTTCGDGEYYYLRNDECLPCGENCQEC